jgi:hypothetical protein
LFATAAGFPDNTLRSPENSQNHEIMSLTLNKDVATGGWGEQGDKSYSLMVAMYHLFHYSFKQHLPFGL